jgi:hypothetical protein
MATVKLIVVDPGTWERTWAQLGREVEELAQKMQTTRAPEFTVERIRAKLGNAQDRLEQAALPIRLT